MLRLTRGRRWLGPVVAGLVLMAPAAADAAQRYASPTGTGPGATCPQSDPCSLADAVEHPSVMASDEVIIEPGVYNETSLLLIDDDIYVHGTHGTPSAVTIVTNSDQGVWLDSPGATLSDVNIDHSGSTDGLLILRGLAERVGVSTTGLFACSLGASTVDLAVLRDSTCFGGGSGGAALRVHSGGGPVYGTAVNVTAIGGDNRPAVNALAGGSGSATLFMHNTIARGGQSAAGDVTARDTDGTGSADVVASYSNYDTEQETAMGGTASVTDPGTGTNQNAAPALLPFAGFPQGPNSPTINAGAPDPLLGQFDLSGGPRTEGSAPDIGADEADGTPPSVSIDSGPSGVTTDSTPTFTFSASESVTFECRLDVGAFEPCSGPGDSHTTAPLADGLYTFEVRATDGYNATIASRSFEVDSTPDPPDTNPPETRIDRGPASRSSKKRAKFRFSSNEAGSSFECKLDRAAFAPCDSPKRYRDLAAGRHRFQVRAIDAAGNVDPTPARHRWRRTRS
jgi:hypothetical protein